MDVLIKGLSLPKEPKLLLLGIDEFGNVCRVSSEHLHFKGLYNSKAIELPEHGALKDTDFIISCLDEIKDTYPRTYEIVKGILDRTPTVLGAST